jgi:murein DD-endopeptidase MepM/ murein hydrolase activator NlpD
MKALRLRRETLSVMFRITRAAACCMLALMLTACLGMRSGRDQERMYDGGYAPQVLDIGEDLDLDAEMNSAWANPGELVDDAASHPDVCIGDCLADEYGNGEAHGLLPWEEPDDLSLGPEPMRPLRAAPRSGSGKVRAQPGRSMTSASMPSGRIPRPAHEMAAMCNGSQTICISSPFGVKRPGHMHKGVDIRAPFGSPIKAFRSGVVADARWHHSYGKVVEVRQDDGLIARYAHMSQILVRAGERVWQGQPLGRVGSTGRSSGPHLHFELIRGSQHMNPMVQLKAPAHVVSHATERDALQARAAMASGRPGGAGRSRVIDRHAAVRPGRAAAHPGRLSMRGKPASKGAKAKAQVPSAHKDRAGRALPADRSAASRDAKKPGKGASASRAKDRPAAGSQKAHGAGQKAAAARTQAKPAQTGKAGGKAQKPSAAAKGKPAAKKR